MAEDHTADFDVSVKKGLLCRKPKIKADNWDKLWKLLFPNERVLSAGMRTATECPPSFLMFIVHEPYLVLEKAEIIRILEQRVDDTFSERLC